MEEKIIVHAEPITPLYNHFQLAFKYLRYYLTASSGKGHGIHSPFVFGFIINVLNDDQPSECYKPIEQRRAELLRNKDILEVEDFGAGSATIRTNQRVVRHIAGSSLKSRKFGQLLYRVVRHFKPATMLELGTSLGITSSYLASGNRRGTLYTLEGSAAIAGIAAQTFNALKIDNVELIEGDFAHSLPPLLERIGRLDLAFIDGNHRKQPTLQYFESLLMISGQSTILIFDDIHWSTEMEAAWSEIMEHPAVTCTIDLFFIGLVFLNNDFKVKQHFTVRF